MSDYPFFAQRTTGWATSVWATSEKGNSKIERMSVSDPVEKIESGADSEPWKNERVPSSGVTRVDKIGSNFEMYQERGVLMKFWLAKIGNFYGWIIFLLKLHLIKNFTFYSLTPLKGDKLREKPPAFESEHPDPTLQKMRFVLFFLLVR